MSAPTWSSILANSRALLNDQVDAVYHDEVLLAYLNMALQELQEIYELNDIPVTHQTSAVVTVAAGITRIAFTGTVPQLPPDLIEIHELFESDAGQNVWTPVTKRSYLTTSLIGDRTPIAKFGVWSWENQEIHLLESLQDNDLKMDYIKSVFPELTLTALQSKNNILNSETFLQYRVAGLAAEFIEENFIRADKLNAFGAMGLERGLGISVKAQQVIPVRRRPFRASFKRRRVIT
jgi:hypothetical protein